MKCILYRNKDFITFGNKMKMEKKDLDMEKKAEIAVQKGRQENEE